jgi:hypothetical protein
VTRALALLFLLTACEVHPDESMRREAFRDCVLAVERDLPTRSVARDEAIRACNEEFYR